MNAEPTPAGAKSPTLFRPFTARLKPCPFKTDFGDRFQQLYVEIQRASIAVTIASCRAGRISRMRCALRSGQVRFVSNVTDKWRCGSIHSDVPVKPRWPKDDGEKCVPEDDGCDGVSHPSAREVPDDDSSRRVKRATVAGFTRGAPPFRRHSAKRARSVAEENMPACPLTPPITQAFSSLTSP